MRDRHRHRDSNKITKDTIDTLKLRRRGIEIDAPVPSRMAQIAVSEAMGRAPKPLRPDQPQHAIVKRFATERTDSLPVTAADGPLIGIIAAVDVERAIDRSSGDTTNGASLTREAPRLLASDSLENAVVALGGSDDEGLPVSDERDQLIRWGCDPPRPSSTRFCWNARSTSAPRAGGDMSAVITG